MSDQEHGGDPRPKPKYGELAPEGWTWTPPEDQNRLDTSRGSETPDADEQTAPGGQPGATGNAQPTPPGWAPGAAPFGSETGPGTAAPFGVPQPHYAGAPVDGGTVKVAPYWNRPVTIVLILVGLLGALVSISTLASIPQSMQVVYTSEKLGVYHAPASLAAIILAGQIVQGLLWTASLVISSLLLSRSRLSFYVPLITGAVAAIALVVFVFAVIATDPALMSLYNRS